MDSCECIVMLRNKFHRVLRIKYSNLSQRDNWKNLNLLVWFALVERNEYEWIYLRLWSFYDTEKFVAIALFLKNDSSEEGKFQETSGKGSRMMPFSTWIRPKTGEAEYMVVAIKQFLRSNISVRRQRLYEMAIVK